MKQKITIIEDNKDMSELIKTFLSDDGFETVQYFSAESALEGFEKDNTDLFILDINLPGMNGFDFLTELRKIGTNVNQIARACNSGEISNPNLVVFQRELKNIWQSLKSKPPKEI